MSPVREEALASIPPHPRKDLSFSGENAAVESLVEEAPFTWGDYGKIKRHVANDVFYGLPSVSRKVKEKWQLGCRRLGGSGGWGDKWLSSEHDKEAW